jgi:hypothetical protein
MMVNNNMRHCLNCGKSGIFQTGQFFYKGRHHIASWCSEECRRAVDYQIPVKGAKLHCLKCAGEIKKLPPLNKEGEG